MTKPPRTIGISLAIIAGVFLFSCLPLTQSIILLSLSARPGMDFMEVESGGQGDTTIVGSEILDINQTPLIIQAIVATAFLTIAALAWRGKPPFIRFVFVGIVLLLTAGNLLQVLALLSAPSPTPLSGIDSASDVSRALRLAQLCMTLLIPAYIVWYLNRGPARAFFRGRYLDTPSADPGSKG